MFYRFCLILSLFYALSYVPFIFSAEKTLFDLKKERENNQQYFSEMASQYQQCHKVLQESTDRFNNLQEEILEKEALCEKPRSSDEYKECIGSLSGIITDLQNLREPVSGLQKSCPLFSSETLIRRLSRTISELEIEFDHLSGRNDFIAMDVSGTQNMYERDKLSECLDSLRIIGNGVLGWRIIINLTLSGLVPDLYKVTQGLLAFKIYNDYALQTLALCDENVDPEKTNNYELYANRIDEENKKRDEFIFESSKRYGPSKFNENAEKICQFLANKRGSSDNHRAASAELCVNPLNNPSWIYSAHYLVKNDYPESLENR